MLQTYLLEIFSHAKKCAHNFENTEWYLNQKLDEKSKKEIMDFFKSSDIKCDCEVLNKIEINTKE